MKAIFLVYMVFSDVLFVFIYKNHYVLYNLYKSYILFKIFKKKYVFQLFLSYLEVLLVHLLSVFYYIKVSLY